MGRALALHYRPTVLLTRIWAVFLAVLAVGCLAGMFVLSAASSGDFGDADRRAIRAVTEAGTAALEAEIQASSTQRVSTLMNDPRLQEALERDSEEELPDDAIPLSQIFAELTEQLRVETETDMSVALVGSAGQLIEVNGISEQYIPELVGSDAYKRIPPTKDATFSILLGDEIYVAKLTTADTGGRRLLAVDRLKIGAGSLLRRVLGSEVPAGIVRDGKLVGGIIGDQAIEEEVIQLFEERAADVPDEGASKVFTVGKGLDARIGALGRVPGPAGVGPSGAMLAVLSRNTAAAGQQDLAEALGRAREKGLLGRVNWVMLVGLLIVCAALAVYLPGLEAAGPLRRLRAEFEGLGRGAQHQIFHERYSGAPGQVARAAAAAYDALRQAFLAELEIEDDLEEADEHERPRTMRARRLTRAHKKLEDAAKSGTAPNPAPGRRRRTGSRAHRAVTGKRSQRLSATPRAVDLPDEPDTSQVPSPAPTPTPEAPIEEFAAASVGAPDVQPVTAAPPVEEAPEPVTAPAPKVEPALPQPPPVAAPPPLSAPPIAPPPPRPPAAPPIARPPAAEAPAPAAEPDGAGSSYREIFDEFVQVKAACGEPTENLTFDRFAAKLRKNERDLRKKRPGIRDVQFTVYVKDGKAALKAKVVK